jgi:hypothetical protein
MSIEVHRPVVSIEPSPRPGGSTDVVLDDLVSALRPRLADAAPGVDLDVLVREAFAELGPVRVTTYLQILVERRVRERLRSASFAPRVTA